MRRRRSQSPSRRVLVLVLGLRRSRSRDCVLCCRDNGVSSICDLHACMGRGQSQVRPLPLGEVVVWYLGHLNT